MRSNLSSWFWRWLSLAVLVVGGVTAARAQTSIAAGGGFFADDGAHPVGFVSLVQSLDAEGRTFSFTTFEYTVGPTKDATLSPRTGIGTLLLRSSPELHDVLRYRVDALANGGFITDTVNTSGAFAGGGTASLNLFKLPFDILLGVQAFNSPVTGGWRPQFNFGLRLAP